MLGNPPYTFKTGIKSNFEHWLYKTKAEYAFVDFTALNASIGNKNILFRMAGGGDKFHHYSHKAPWHRIYDGVFFIREMERCRPVSIGR